MVYGVEPCQFQSFDVRSRTIASFYHRRTELDMEQINQRSVVNDGYIVCPQQVVDANPRQQSADETSEHEAEIDSLLDGPRIMEFSDPYWDSRPVHQPGLAPTPSSSIARRPVPRPSASIARRQFPTPTPSIARRQVPTPTPSIARRPVPKPPTSIARRSVPTPPSSSGGLHGDTLRSSLEEDRDPPWTMHHLRTYDFQNSMTAYAGGQFADVEASHANDGSKQFKKDMDYDIAAGYILLSLFSTILSGIFFIIAIRAPRYGKSIGTDGSLTISKAAFLTSFCAKMIELSFVTILVAFIGQCLARRAFDKAGKTGVTIADMHMRLLPSQPGMVLTQPQSVRYAASTWLGVLTIIATIAALLYTSASTALVQPQLKFSQWEARTVQGLVATSFANTGYVQQKCKTPIVAASGLDDEVDSQLTCLQIDHASHAYHNYQHWLSTWADFATAGNGSAYLASRPKGYAMFNDNTTVIGPWIEKKNITMHQPEGWIINNVTMAFPHPGVVQAAQDPANGIMQPNELNGLGIYSIRASVPSPFINITCAMGIDEASLAPFLYRNPNNGVLYNNSTLQPHQPADPYLDGTPFDAIFEWGPDYGEYNWPPIFPMLPSEYNTLANDTTNLPFGRKSIYVLGKGGVTVTTNYALCELRVGQTPDCSTQYNASSNSATLEAICSDRKDGMRYVDSTPDATSGNDSYNSDWPKIASMWVASINMASGVIGGNSSTARLWSELIFSDPLKDWKTGELLPNINLPSPAEALAVMSGCTLLQSALDAPFVEY